MSQGNKIPLPLVTAADSQRLAATYAVIAHIGKAVPRCNRQISSLYNNPFLTIFQALSFV
jgi:hypothetical protein